MAMIAPSAQVFSNDAWMRAVVAHVPGMRTLVSERQVSAFRLFAARRATLPLAHIESNSTALTPCPLPAVSRKPTVEDAERFLNHLAVPLVLRSVPVDHPVTETLLKAAAHVKVLKTWQRAALDVSGSFETWMAENFDHKRRKELKRLKSRLSEQGKLDLLELKTGEDLTPHMTAFLAVESSGWKGKRGTAINSDAEAAKGLSAGLEAMHVEGKLRFWTMTLDGRPVASLFALVDGGEAVLGKIGYDEAFGKFSPGVLLIIEATQALFAEEGIRLADANAIPGHPMIDRIWRDRIACMDVVLAGPAVGGLTFAIVSRFHGMKDALRSVAKQVFLRATGRKQS